ncbi:DUF1304 domain-containing protein [Luethyella okanaganae]|uniref:DUF1304 domain-containing protein n=1 Tax=Luethyella okanaganae TaxID=69372 RepID=A0ABW1VIC2_9MICO
MLVTSLAFVGLAAIVHVYIFVLESLRWTASSTRKTFGTTVEQAETTKSLAFNQGFYNLFLAIVAAAGIIAVGCNQLAVGAALVIAAAGSMVLAGLVLVVSDHTKLRAALVQLTAPAIGLILLAFALAG